MRGRSIYSTRLYNVCTAIDTWTSRSTTQRRASLTSGATAGGDNCRMQHQGAMISDGSSLLFFSYIFSPFSLSPHGHRLPDLFICLSVCLVRVYIVIPCSVNGNFCVGLSPTLVAPGLLMCQRSYLSTWYESLDAFSGDMLGYHSFSNLSDLVAIDFGTLWRLNILAFEIRGIVRFSFIFFG